MRLYGEAKLTNFACARNGHTVAREANMKNSRRDALKLITGTACVAALPPLFARAQDPSKRNPATASGEDALDPKLDPKRAKTILEQNQKDLKRDIQRLFQLASELKEESEKTDAMTTLSLALLKKTEEIEKLARQIRDKARG